MERKTPWVTGLLILSCIFVFLNELRLSHSPINVNQDALYQMGATYTGCLQDGNFWRLFTSMWVHVSWTHLIMNMIGLWYLGSLLEPMVGHIRFLLAYLLSGIIGDTLALYHLDGFTAGASTAIFGLIGFALGLGYIFHMRGLTSACWQIILLNLVIDIFTPGISLMGHLGGLLGGLILSLFLHLGAGYFNNLLIQIPISLSLTGGLTYLLIRFVLR